MALPVRALPTIQNWECQSCSECCRTYAVRVSETERERILKQGWMSDPAFAGIEPMVHDRALGEYRLNHQPDGACVFLDEQNRCRIHAKFGEAAKPLACRLYPIVMIPAGDHWRVGIRFACPSAANNWGTPLTDQALHLQKMADVLAEEMGVSPKNNQPQILQAKEVVEWPDLLQFLKSILELVSDTKHPLERRLRQVCALADVCKKSRFDAVTGSRLAEFLQVMLAVVRDEVPADPFALRKPSWIGRMLFRQYLAIYSRKDRGRTPGVASTGRIVRLRAAWRFAMGTGRVPRLHGLMPHTTFAAIEQPGFALPAESEMLLQRYFLVKLQSLQFFGAANFGRAFWDGLDSLLLTFPVMMWLARVFAADGTRSPADAISLASQVMDDHFGFNPLLGGYRQNWANRTIAERGDIPKFIAWYSRISS